MPGVVTPRPASAPTSCATCTTGSSSPQRPWRPNDNAPNRALPNASSTTSKRRHLVTKTTSSDTPKPPGQRQATSRRQTRQKPLTCSYGTVQDHSAQRPPDRWPRSTTFTLRCRPVIVRRHQSHPERPRNRLQHSAKCLLKHHVAVLPQMVPPTGFEPVLW